MLEGDKKKVMEDSEQITAASSKRKVDEFVKDATIDTLVDEKTKNRVMENCGYSCSVRDKSVMESAKSRRKKHESIDEFLEAEQRNPRPGTQLIREGDILTSFTHRNHSQDL